VDAGMELGPPMHPSVPGPDHTLLDGLARFPVHRIHEGSTKDKHHRELPVAPSSGRQGNGSSNLFTLAELGNERMAYRTLR